MPRLDIYLLKSGLAETRTIAQRLIKRGVVRVNGLLCDRASQRIRESDHVEVCAGEAPRFVSIGGEKLQRAITRFGLNLSGHRVLDIGASTGGFTDCALQHGAIIVYAVDVGRDQLHPRLRADSRVRSMEQQDIRKLGLDQLDGNMPETIVCDASFISLTLILPRIESLLASNGQAICLVKPQFELGPGVVNRHGVVSDLSAQVRALEHVLRCAGTLGLHAHGLTHSPLGGPGRNTEYLLLLRRDAPRGNVDPSTIAKEALREFSRCDTSDFVPLPIPKQ